jgi:hypothetical protein
MLLLVVGLVVLVLVIVVVVFLSVRSMHVEDDGSYGASAARRDTGGRASAARDSGARRTAGGAANGSGMNGNAMNGGGRRRGEAGPPPAAGRVPGQESAAGRMSGQGGAAGRFSGQESAAGRVSGQPGPAARPGQPVPAARRGPSGEAQPGAGGPVPGARRGGRDRDEQRSPGLPRQRGYEHDQDGDSWDRGDWGGVSDEQYWAELSSDRPLTTTARSAQAGAPPVRSAAAEPTQRLRRPAGDTPQFADPQSAGGRFEAPRETGDDPFGGQQFRDPAGAPDPDDTNPGRNGGRAASGRDGAWGATQPPTAAGWGADEPPSSRAAQDAPTAAWRAADSPRGASQAPEPSTADWAPSDARRGWDTPDTAEPSWGGPDEVAGDWRADEPSADRWAAGDEPDRRPAWDAGDPLTSDAFSLHGAHSGGQDRYDTRDGQDYDEAYGSHQGSGGGYQPGELEPLPEPAGRGADWHSAPVPANGFAADRDGHGWDDGRGFDSGHDGYPAAEQRNGHARSGRDWEPDGAGGGWADRDQQGWAEPEPGYRQNGDYQHGQGYDQADGYSLPGSHHSQDPGYGRAPHEAEFPDAAAYDLPGYDTAEDGYGEWAGYGQQPRHGYGPR